MPGPFTTPVAFSTPFESEPERENSFVKKNVQEAIEECLALAISNDVFMILASYGGHANTGRFLEYYSGLDSSIAPLFLPRGSNVIAIVAATTAKKATCKIGFYNTAITPATLLYEVEFVDQKRVTLEGTVTSPLFQIAAASELGIRISSGSINKPHLQVVFSSALDGGS